MDQAGAVADSNVLLHVRKARAVVESVNSIAVIVDEFHAPLGIEAERRSMEATRWWDAFRDPGQLKNAGVEARTKAVIVGVGVAAFTVAARAEFERRSED